MSSSKKAYSTTSEDEEYQTEETNDDDVILDDIKKEDVIEQLRELGYSDDIPESLVDEFMAEIKKKNASLKMKSSMTDTTEDEEPVKPRNIKNDKKKLKAQIELEDEEEEEEPEEEEEDLDDEEVPMKKKSTKKAVSDHEMEFNFSPPKLKQEKKPKPEAVSNIEKATALISQSQQSSKDSKFERTSLPSQQQTKDDFLVNKKKLDVEAIEPSMTSMKSSQRPSSARSSVSNTSSCLSSSTTSSYRIKTVANTIKPKKPVTYRQKVHDPVARFHTMSKTWKKDTFLKNNQTSHSALRWQVRQEMREIAGDPYLP